MGGKKEFSVAHLSLIWFYFFFSALSFLLSILSYTALFSLFVFGFLGDLTSVDLALPPLHGISCLTRSVVSIGMGLSSFPLW